VQKYCIRILGTGLSVFFVALSLYNPALFHELRLKFFDILMRQMPAQLGETPVVIVDIDSASLAELGQWPWSRHHLATLLENLTAAGPAVIGFDMLFAEPDRSAPQRLKTGTPLPAAVQDYLASLPDPDLHLAETLAASPVPVILGHIFTQTPNPLSPTLPERSRFILFNNPEPAHFLHRFKAVEANLALFEQAAQGSGFFNIVQDQDAILRHLLLIAQVDQHIYPSLVLAMVQAAVKVPSIRIDTGDNGIRSLGLGPYTIPVTRKGELIVNLSGPARTLPYLSAAQVIAAQFDPLSLQGAYVLIGTSAPGLFDLQAVPTDQHFPGVEFHGHALNTILTGSFLHRPEWIPALEAFIVLLLCLILLVFLPKMQAVQGVLLAMALVAAILLFSWFQFRWNHLLVDVVYPTVTVSCLFTALTFINYFTKEKETRQLRFLFSQYLAPAVVEELVQQHDHVVLNGEERELSILFSDIRNFTCMAEKMPPTALCSFLNEYLTPMTQAIMERRGTVDKFIGDAIMAFWNAPLTTPDHLAQACNCALDMLHELARLNFFWQQRGLPTIRIGLGIHCGVVRVGNMGSQQRFEYTVIGDAVNLASRLEGLTKLYGTDILVSKAVYELLAGQNFFFRPVDRVRVLGRKEEVSVYQLLGKKGSYTFDIKENQQYTLALGLYDQGNFSSAGLVFRQLTELYPKDRLYALYLERCGHWAEHPPAQWDGITELQNK
jgi:adenylate cyclase